MRERGLVLWVDAEGQSQRSPFVDELGGAELGFAYPVVALRGSYLK
ncbi:MAG TPA: hypothetical protein VK524_21755 [Polyangiaceae bacterium]|nr:hypothetical protein [Polyangiaceae bacterium]